MQNINPNKQFKIFSFYQFINLTNTKNIQKSVFEFASIKKIKGTTILSKEGINGTMAGTSDNMDEFLYLLKSLNFNELNIKESYSFNMPFYRIKVKIKKEIVSMLNKPIDTDLPRAIHIDSKDWNNLIDDDDVLILDVRNKYETDMGYFNKAIIPDSDSFVEFKNFIDNKLSRNKNKKIAMYCTGGIRCEKASFYMRSNGFKNIYQLNGGILKYLEDISSDDNKWNGECFVFDNRVSVNESLDPGTYELCRGCNNPISKEEKFLDGYEKDVSCTKCHKKSTESRKNNFRERSKQVDLAKERDESYIYDTINYNQYINDINLDNL